MLGRYFVLSSPTAQIISLFMCGNDSCAEFVIEIERARNARSNELLRSHGILAQMTLFK